MDILSVEIENFGPIEKANLTLCERGLVNIEGENKDDPSANSNGSGKSMLADAIRWCLYGTTARGVKGDEVIANFAKYACVQSVLKDGDQMYLVQRWRKDKRKSKSSGVALFLFGEAGEMIDLTQGTDALTQKKIESVLGSTEEVFTKAVYAGQEAMPDLPNMTDREIKLLVEEASGVELLSQAYVYAQEHSREVSRELKDASAKVEATEHSMVRSQGDLKEASFRLAQWGDQKKATVSMMEAAVETFRDHLKEARKKREALPATEKIEALIETLEGRIKAVASERDQENHLMRELSSAQAKASVANSALSNALNRFKTEQTAVATVSSRVGTPCKSCGKPHTEDDLAEVTRRAKEQLEKVATEAKEAKANSEAAAKTLASAQTKLDEHKAGMTDVTEVTSKLSSARLVLGKIKEANRDVQDAEAKVVDAQERAKAAVEATNPHTEVVARAEKRLADDTLAWETAKATRTTKEAAVVAADKAVAVLGPKGVRAHILDTVTPFLNDRTAHYLGTLSDGLIEAVWTTLSTTSKGELTEKFSIEVRKEGGGQSFKALSGGQKRKVRLACALALQDLVASRATKPIRLLMLDEVDDALDEAGLERLMAILEEKGREKGTVLIISHNSLKDWVRQTATVTMEGGRSKVSGALTEESDD